MRAADLPPLIRNEGARALMDMTPGEAQQFARLAAAMAVQHDNLARGLRDALKAHVAAKEAAR